MIGPKPQNVTDTNAAISGAAGNADAVRTAEVLVATRSRGPKINAQHEYAVLEVSNRVADDGEIHEVGLRLVDEPLPLDTGHGR